MAVASGGGVFVSYRRQESSHFAGRLHDRLADRFGEDRVFIDVDAIEPGMDWAEAIDRAVAECSVLLAVIGPGWLAASGPGSVLTPTAPAAAPARPPAPGGTTGDRATRLFTTAEAIAGSLTDGEEKAQALIGIAVAPALDRGRAARLFTDAENMIRSLTDEPAPR